MIHPCFRLSDAGWTHCFTPSSLSLHTHTEGTFASFCKGQKTQNAPWNHKQDFFFFLLLFFLLLLLLLFLLLRLGLFMFTWWSSDCRLSWSYTCNLPASASQVDYHIQSRDVCVCVQVCVRVQVCVHVCLHMCKWQCKHMCTHACVCTHVDTNGQC